MKVFGVIVCSLVLVINVGCTPSFVSKYSGTSFVEFADFFGDDVVYIEEIPNQSDKIYFKGNSLQTTAVNMTDFKCNFEKKLCILALDFIYLPFSIDTSAGTIKLIDSYKIREQHNLRLHARLAFIEGSDYFLTSSLSKYGLIRWKYGQTSVYSQIKYSDISQVSDTLSLMVVPNSKFALLSYTGLKMIILSEFVTMKEIRKITATAGLLAPLTSDQSKAFFVSAYESTIEKLTYLDNTKLEKTVLDYAIKSVRNVQWTDFIIAATWQQVYVVSCSGSGMTYPVNSYPYYYSLSNMINSMSFRQSTGQVLLSGYGFVNTLQDTSSVFCHPFCQGCSKMLSESMCTSCSSTTTISNGACTQASSSIKAPPGGTLVPSEASWSEDTVKKEEKKFNIKDYFIYILIGAGGLLGICCIFCICKMCCGDSEDQGKNKVHQRKNPDDED